MGQQGRIVAVFVSSVLLICALFCISYIVNVSTTRWSDGRVENSKEMTSCVCTGNMCVLLIKGEP